jgi:beta-phosphoglucomutase
MIKAILFDMDGVLIEAKEWHYLALNKALESIEPKYLISLEDHLKYYDGLPTKKKLSLLSKFKGLEEKHFQTIYHLKQKYIFKFIETLCKPNTEITNLLSWLNKEQYKIACCSNSIKKTVELVLKKMEIFHLFDIYLSNEDVVSPKPSPEIYLKAMNLLFCSPSECLVVEDNENGIQSAKASGAFIFKVNKVKDVNRLNFLMLLKTLNNQED